MIIDSFANPLIFFLASVIINTIQIFNTRKIYFSGCYCSFKTDIYSSIIMLIISLFYSIAICGMIAGISYNFSRIFFQEPHLVEKINLCVLLSLSTAIILFDKLKHFTNTRLIRIIERKFLRINDKSDSQV